jgi:F0F1-type ATP synthase delta subunit
MSKVGPDTTSLILPLAIVSRTDLGRLQLELDQLDEFLSQAAIRKTGKAMQLPKTTRFLDEITEENKLNLLQQEDRKILKTFLEKVRKESPVIHISFSSDPQPAFLQKITAWFRKEIHPFLFLHVGLQPDIAAGCIIRTPNRYFDLSLRKHFYEEKVQLLEKISTGAVQ